MIRPILVYLDTCTWCRPFDDQMQDRIRMLVKRGISLSVKLDEGVKKIAVVMERLCGLHGGDALQVASAKISGAKYFITTDEGISERAKCISK